MRFQRILLSSLFALSTVACGDDDGVADAALADAAMDAPIDTTLTDAPPLLDAGADAALVDVAVADAGGADVPEVDAGSDAGPVVECDYQTVDGVLVIEAEDLPLTGDWQVASDEAGAVGEYIVWTGDSFFNDPSNGVMQMQVNLTEPGRYRFQWRTRIGRGSDVTEHNDTWVRFPDADAFFGAKGPTDNERRVYPRPLCQDDAFTSMIEAMPDVVSAACPVGAQRDGWFKVASSGARDWMWSSFTNDGEGFDVYIEVSEPGVYLFEMAARSDYSLIDQIILYHEDVTSADAQARAGTTTECP